ncbi:MAG: non-canonical purine NTP pyrophosphatase [Limisphaerales bacterium]
MHLPQGLNPEMTTLLIATRNPHKVGEIQAVLGPGFHCLTLSAFPEAPTVIEDAATFAGNAILKAVTLASWLESGDRVPAGERWFVLADDSGLEVDALDGAPGVHSARFAALEIGQPGNSSDADNNARLLRLLAGVSLPLRTARFRCAIAVVEVERPATHAGTVAPAAVPATCPPDGGCAHAGKARTFEGACEGQIRFEPRGQAGFGYDPLFQPDGFELTFAELGEAAKNQISHRARALGRLRDAWNATPDPGGQNRC